MCVEDNDDMVQSYIMVDPHGRFFQNRTGQTGYDYSASIIDVGALAAFESMKWSAQKFSARYPRIDIKAVA
jgi:radical S-adenosyl methionine domain-containing protein 2